jgi:hypothetical protein
MTKAAWFLSALLCLGSPLAHGDWQPRTCNPDYFTCVNACSSAGGNACRQTCQARHCLSSVEVVEPTAQNTSIVVQRKALFNLLAIAREQGDYILAEILTAQLEQLARQANGLTGGPLGGSASGSANGTAGGTGSQPIFLPDDNSELVSIYRFRNANAPGHDFSRSPDSGVEGAVSEGVKFKLFATPTPDCSIALYRCVVAQDHFISTDSGCEGQQRLERLGYSCSGPTGSMTYQLHRTYKNHPPGDHISTIDGEFQVLTSEGYRDEGGQGYVEPAF